ncbi:MAG: HIT family protein [Candidatus Levybacteria bacterium]|nr:HIT family protein [Candidatus Levybacteria bacterium]
MKDCIFCKVINKEVPGYFILEEKEYVAFLDIFGATDGHVMVVPRKHGLSILDYSKDELSEFMEGVQNVAKKLEKNLNTDSITIGINHKEEKGVPHLHIHLIPRFKDDGGKVLQSLVSRGLKEDLTKTKDKIRNNA